MLKELINFYSKKPRKVIFIESTDEVKPGIYTSSSDLNTLKTKYNIIKTFNKNLFGDINISPTKETKSLLDLFEKKIDWGVGIENETIVHSDKEFSGKTILDNLNEFSSLYKSILSKLLVSSNKYSVYTVENIENHYNDISEFKFSNIDDIDDSIQKLIKKYNSDFNLNGIDKSIDLDSTKYFLNFEFITPSENDFYKNKTINIYINEIIQKKNICIQYLIFLENENHINILKYPKIGGYILHNSTNNNFYIDYTGSYHLNLSLPYNTNLLLQERNTYLNYELKLLDIYNIKKQILKKYFSNNDNSLKRQRNTEKIQESHIESIIDKPISQHILNLKRIKDNVDEKTKEKISLAINELNNISTKIYNNINNLSPNTKYITFKKAIFKGDINLKSIETSNNILELFNKKKKYSNGFHKLTKIWAICIQWILPLILSCFSSANPLSIGDNNRFSELTLRSFISGYSFINITDIYTMNFPYQRSIDNIIDKYLIDRLRDVYPNFSLSELEGSEFRADPEKGFNFGFELRIFDNFHTKHLDTLLELLFLLADHMDEQNITLDSINNPVSNKILNDSVIDICMHGWLTQIGDNYKQQLKENLRLPQDIFNFTNTAYDVINKLYNHLQDKFIKNGRSIGTYSQFLIKYDPNRVIKNLPNINRYSWDCAFENLIWNKNMQITEAIINTYNTLFSDESKNIFIDGEIFDSNLKTIFTTELNLPDYKEDCINIRYFMEKYALTDGSDKLRSAKVIPPINNNRLQQAIEIAKQTQDSEFSTLKEDTLSEEDNKLYSNINILLYNAVM